MGGVLRGGYVAMKETGALSLIIMSCGSELQLALAAKEKLGAGVRVVSIPSFHRFDAQPASYREEVLPTSCRARVAVEAGVSAAWWKYVGLDGVTVTIDRFGLSGPGAQVMTALGMTVESVVEAAQSLTDDESAAKRQKKQ
eukprot:NODE_4646_length_781_cov_34.169399_g4302_i0.p1 GENE.NODE_4646_length_781_cov_34.169399_g4302_i0~~NODE_4646_length_781_cov_34.169399_g4302_i0.p1  ORF type:complete len:141 (+),score=29.15 NODE_4646_length_781_cov_34.169399_g4302_i0:33-455(+)